MSAVVRHLLSPHTRDLGGFSVRRLLPAANCRAVGPFIFFDHMGPAVFAPGDGVDVRPHPHIGLATVTYLFEGALLHRDSLGTVQEIQPGDVNWMTAGRGIVRIGDEVLPLDRLAVLEPGQPVRIEADADARLMLLGGAPLDAPRHMWWNLVSSDPALIEQARQDWAAGRFPEVPGESERIPLPDR